LSPEASDLPTDSGPGDTIDLDRGEVLDDPAGPTEVADVPDTATDSGPDLAPAPCDPEACGGPCAEPCSACTPLVGAEILAFECVQCGGDDFCLRWSDGYHVRASCFPHRIETLHGAFVTNNGGTCWVPSEQPSPPPTGVYRRLFPWAWVAAPEAALLYVEADGTMRRSTDGGRTFIQPAFGQKLQGIWALAAHPGSGRLYAVGSNQWSVARSDDGGATYASATVGKLTFADWPVPDVRALAASPGDPDLVLVGGRWHREGLSATYDLARSVDGGASWSLSRVNSGIADTVLSLTFAPTLPARVYATTAKQGLLRSDDGGVTWTRVADGKAGVPEVHPRDPDHLWTGIKVSLDGGITWADQDLGLAGARLVRITCPPDPQVPCREWALQHPDAYGGPQRILTRSEGGAWTEVMDGLPTLEHQVIAFTPAAVFQSPAALDEAVVVFQAVMTLIF
jgi:hypothetical protein